MATGRAPKFDPSEFRDLHDAGRDAFAADHPDVSRETLARLGRYVDMLTDWQSRMNLVAPSTLADVWERHIADSVQLSGIVPHVPTIADLGSGGGLPGIVLAILRPGTKVHLIESVGKKAAFLRAVAADLDLDTHVHARRIEACGAALARSDAITARALASLDRLCALVAPHLKEGAACYFAKGENHEAEIAAARANWSFDLEVTPSRLAEGSALLRLSCIRARRGARASTGATRR